MRMLRDQHIAGEPQPLPLDGHFIDRQPVAMARRRQTPHAQPIHGQFLAIAHHDISLAGFECPLNRVADAALVTSGERLGGLGRADDLNRSAQTGIDTID